MTEPRLERTFYLVLPKDFKSDKRYVSDDGAVFVNPDEKDFKHWNEHKHIWEVVKVIELLTK